MRGNPSSGRIERSSLPVDSTASRNGYEYTPPVLSKVRIKGQDLPRSRKGAEVENPVSALDKQAKTLLNQWAECSLSRTRCESEDVFARVPCDEPFEDAGQDR